MKNIAIFGGSFNPPHIGHQMMLMYLCYSCSFDEIWVNPVYHHYFDKDKYLISLNNRVEMSIMAFEKIDDKIKVKTIDIDNKFSKTYETICFLKEKYKEINFTLILGEDNYQSRHNWYRFEDIEKMVEIIFLGRMNVNTELKLPFKFPSISSSEIRKDIEKNQKLLDKDVYNYIILNKLYNIGVKI